MSRSLTSVKDLSQDEVWELIEIAKFYKRRFKRGDKNIGGLKGKTMVNIFFEPSTRTRMSFELAAKRMNMDVVNFIADASSLLKDETLFDTIKTLDAMNPDVHVIRTKKNHLPKELTAYTNTSVINAGDGVKEHPTQALLDYFTMAEDQGFKDDNYYVAIVGDLAHSRVAGSNIKLLKKMGCHVYLAGPQEWMPKQFKNSENVYFCSSVEEAIDKADYVMTLRVQREREINIPKDCATEDGKFDPKRYHELYGIKSGMIKKKQKLLHPGPVNRDVEVSDNLVYNKSSLILEQVTNGVATRSAVLDFLLKGDA